MDGYGLAGPVLNMGSRLPIELEKAQVNATCKGKAAWVPESVAPWLGLEAERVVFTSEGAVCKRPPRRRTKLSQGIGSVLYSIGGDTAVRVGFPVIYAGLGWGIYSLLRR